MILIIYEYLLIAMTYFKLRVIDYKKLPVTVFIAEFMPNHIFSLKTLTVYASY